MSILSVNTYHNRSLLVRKSESPRSFNQSSGWIRFKLDH